MIELNDGSIDRMIKHERKVNGNMKIVVTTPAGNIGRGVVRELLAPEFSVRVIVRDPARVPEEIREEVEIVRGSTDDAATLRRALDGAEALFWCVPRQPLQGTNVQGHYERFARAGCRAIREAGVPRVVTISACGKGLARNAGPISGLHAMEDILNESGAAIRHLRCGWFMENFLEQAESICQRGMFSFPMPGHVPIPMVAASDIADVVLRWLVRRDWKDIQGIAVQGPKDLSFIQAASAMEPILERRLRYREASASHYAQTLVGLGASAEHARGVVELYAELAQGITRAEPRTAESTTTRTLAAWAESNLLPQAELLRSPSKTEAVSACTCKT